MTPAAADLDTARGLAVFNELADREAADAAASCCPWEPFVTALIGGRPYSSAAALVAEACAQVDAISAAELPAVLSRYPQIGVDSRKNTTAANWSRQEEAGVHGAQEQLRHSLVSESTRYADHFGYTYVVAAAGRGAEEILADLRARLAAEPAAELEVARGQLRAICSARALKLLAGCATAR